MEEIVRRGEAKFTDSVIMINVISVPFYLDPLSQHNLISRVDFAIKNRNIEYYQKCVKFSHDPKLYLKVNVFMNTIID
jgi:hypothetical protein